MPSGWSPPGKVYKVGLQPNLEEEIKADVPGGCRLFLPECARGEGGRTAAGRAWRSGRRLCGTGSSACGLTRTLLHPPPCATLLCVKGPPIRQRPRRRPHPLARAVKAELVFAHTATYPDEPPLLRVRG